MRLPVRLERPPLVEAIFELRFETNAPSGGDLLPGLLFSQLRDVYPEFAPLPLSSVPREIRERDGNLRFKPAHRLAGKSSVVQVGDHSITVSKSPPYVGWADFSAEIRRVLEALRGVRLVTTTPRCSFRCINVLPAPLGAQLQLLNGSFELGGLRAPEAGFQFRTEFKGDGLVTIVQLATNATTPTVQVGLVVDVDVVHELGSADFWASRDLLLDLLHGRAKKMFFSLLTDSTISLLGPTWSTP
jgi:uncharacterized protein (TIGR04255 family)